MINLRLNSISSSDISISSDSAMNVENVKVITVVVNSGVMSDDIELISDTLHGLAKGRHARVEMVDEDRYGSDGITFTVKTTMFPLDLLNIINIAQTKELMAMKNMQKQYDDKFSPNVGST